MNMYYFFFAFPLLVYFELLGRLLFIKINKKPLDFSFVIGILFTMAFLYVVGWPISAFNWPSIVYVCLVLVFFFFTIISIIRNFKALDFVINKKLLLLFISLFIIQIIVSYYRTLGDPHGFDALYYINYIGFNVDTPALNTNHPHFGTVPNTYKDTITYVFQSYYYFVPSIIFILKTIGNMLGLTIETIPALVWTFQMISTAFFTSVSILSIKEINSNNKILNVTFTILLVLFMGNFYYNNAYGWIGNNFRMSIHAIATIFLFRYFKSKDKKDLWLFFLSMLGMCGFSSTGTFAFVFVLFGLFFVLYNKEPNLIKYYAIVLCIPTLNILTTKLGAHWWLSLGTISLFVIIYFLNNTIINIYKNKYIRYGTVIFLTLFMIVASLYLTHNLFDFNVFFNNYSEFQDMSWDYFDFKDLRHWIFNLLVLIPMFYFLFKERKHPFSAISWLLILIIYNPFCCTFMNKINWVYYRTYDIIINQYTLIFFINYLIDQLTHKKILSLGLLGLSSVLAIVQIPRYYHESFVPSDNYNNIYKIDNSELEMIYAVRNLITDYDIKNPKIITPTFYMPTYFKDSTYLIGKEKRYNWGMYSDNSYDLYNIFFPHDSYDDFVQDVKPKFEQVTELLKECDYDILIVDFGLYETINGEYKTIVEEIEKDGTFNHSIYSTSKYAIFYLK